MSEQVKKKGNKIKKVALAATAASAASAYYYVTKHTSFKEEDVVIQGDRGVNIHATVTIPNAIKSMPLVMFCHGYGTDRNSTPILKDVAQIIAKSGIASIRMDFSGTKESEEDFIENNLTNNLFDIDSCYRYMLKNYNIDTKHMALCGYSFGGRRAVIFAGLRKEFKTVALLAPGLTNGLELMDYFFNGQENIEKYQKTAEKEGFVEVTCKEDKPRKLSDKFFKDMYKYDVGKYLSEFEGNMLYIQGANDVHVVPEVSGRILQNLNSKCKLNYVYLDNCNHGFGLWEKDMVTFNKVIDETSKYLIRNV